MRVLFFVWVFVCVDNFGYELAEFPDLESCGNFAASVDGTCVGRRVSQSDSH